jgi:hypothetical protein
VDAVDAATGQRGGFHAEPGIDADAATGKSSPTEIVFEFADSSKAPSDE